MTVAPSDVGRREAPRLSTVSDASRASIADAGLTAGISVTDNSASFWIPAQWTT